MTIDEFLRHPDTQRFIARASRAAAMPLNVRRVQDGVEGLPAAGEGACAACRYVDASEVGRRACRRSRQQPIGDALRRNRPVVFLCHLGLACAVFPVLPETGDAWVAVAGPFCPAEAPHSLRADVLAGLRALEGDVHEELPFSLDDIHLLPATMPPAWAEWFAEALAQRWAAAQGDAPVAPVEADDVDDAHSKRSRRKSIRMTSAQSADLVAALVAGDQPHVRNLLQGVLQEAADAAIAVKRARTVAVVAEALEAAAGAGFDTSPCWARFDAFTADVRQARTLQQLSQAATALLGVLKRHAAKEGPSVKDLRELHAIVASRLEAGVTLNEVAAQLKVHPTAITHRLQRKLGLSYSEYVGRLRVDKAKDLLRRTKLTVAEVARRVGLDDPANFAKLFRRHEGMAPMQYRKKFGRKA